MQIRYTHHARQRMQERRVTETQVERCLHQPDELMTGDQEEWIAISIIGNRRIQVVYGELNEETVLVYTVISVRVLR